MDHPFAHDLDEDDDETFEDELADLPVQNDQRSKPCCARTIAFRQFLESQGPAYIAGNLHLAIDLLASLHLDMTLLLYYGLSDKIPEVSNDPVIQYACSGLKGSVELADIFTVLARSVGARPAVDDFAISVVERKLNAEMRALAPIMTADPNDMEEESIMFDVDKMMDDSKKAAPTFWSLLRTAFRTPRQLKRNKLKCPDFSILSTLATASFSRSQRRCKFPKLMALYFKGCGIGNRGLDTLSRLGTTMSTSWVYTGFEKLSSIARKKMLDAIHILRLPWTGAHDNVNIPHTTFQQRLDNPTGFDSGTLGVIYVHQSPNAILPDPQAFKEQVAAGAKTPITPLDVFELEEKAAPRLREQSVHFLLETLKGAKEFDFATYAENDDPVFKKFAPTYQLPTGAAHATVQYLLGTVHIEEASYQGNVSCFEEWWERLGFTSTENIQRLVRELLVIWKGDRLTVQRLRTIIAYRFHDSNSWDRWDNILPVFGWLHTLMCYVTSIHQQYLGTSSTVGGLRHALNLLNRKGLIKSTTKGHFHQAMTEMLHHVAEAHFRDLWCEVGHVSTLEELRRYGSDELALMAETICDKYASSAALAEHAELAPERQDMVFMHSIQISRDLLDFINLDDAIPSGDVGRIRDFLPRLLFRFIGGGNNNYSEEIMEALQGLEREYTDEARKFVLEFCWLANFTGRANDFQPFDLSVEHAVKDVKRTYGTSGPSTGWDYLEKITPSIPIQRKIKTFVQHNINPYDRGSKHTDPAKEKDVQALQASYANSRIHRYQAGRTFSGSSQRLEDYIALGSDYAKLSNIFSKWVKRRTLTRSRVEDFVSGWPRTGGQAEPANHELEQDGELGSDARQNLVNAESENDQDMTELALADIAQVRFINSDAHQSADTVAHDDNDNDKVMADINDKPDTIPEVASMDLEQSEADEADEGFEWSEDITYVAASEGQGGEVYTREMKQEEIEQLYVLE